MKWEEKNNETTNRHLHTYICLFGWEISVRNDDN